MVWQRAGTVALQNGSTTVVGTNVDFAASSRNGDSFVGPDGATYEVANVASSTVISILPAYKGPTVSGAAYAIMPVQGYDKMLSDAFNNLNNQFGLKLAALGTTGNYEILPVTKGGTGGATASEARSGMGLGTAATRNVGLAASNVMEVGAFGLGTGSPATSLDMNEYVTKVSLITPSTAYSQNIAPGFFGTRIDLGYPGVTQGSQLYMGILPSNFIGFRSGNYASAPFNIIYHTGNTTRAADGTLKAI